MNLFQDLFDRQHHSFGTGKNAELYVAHRATRPHGPACPRALAEDFKTASQEQILETLSSVPEVRFQKSQLISGALSLVLAILSFRHFGDAYAVLLLSLWIGISFVFQGFTAVDVAIGERALPGRGWYIFMGVISVIACVVVLVWPFDSIVVVTLVTRVVIFGVMQIVRPFQIRKDAKAARQTIASLSEHLQQVSATARLHSLARLGSDPAVRPGCRSPGKGSQ